MEHSYGQPPHRRAAARLEALTKKLKRPVVASESFAAQAPGAWDDLGQHRLRGVKAPLRIFAPQV